MYDILRAQSPILKIVQDAMNQELNNKQFPFMGDEAEKNKQAKGPKWHND